MNYSSKRLSTCLVMLFSFILAITAGPRSKAAIKAAAIKALESSSLRMNSITRGQLKMLQVNKEFVVMGYEDGGFVIVSKDDLTPEIIGYSTTDFNEAIKNESFKWYLKAVQATVESIVASGKSYKTIKPDINKFPAQMSPLIKSHWGQESPYNDLCPEGTVSGTGSWQGYGKTGRTVSGCVATAMAQIIYYNRFPARGNGTHSVRVKQANGSYKTVAVNYDESIYDYDNMLNDYNQGSYNAVQGKAVAKLMLDCGVASDMQYATDGSGTYTSNAAVGLRRNFGYPATTRMVERKNFSEEDWMDMVFTEVSAHRAILYTGVDLANGGHAFVLCGYNSDGKVWINWGWNGSADGYYDIALLNPKSSGLKFSSYQDMIIGFGGKPVDTVKDTVTVASPGTLNTLIPDSLVTRISLLKVNGKINSTDIKFIRLIAGYDDKNKTTHSSLSVLDLSDANIVAGGDAYLIEGDKSLTTVDNVLPERAFYNVSGLNKLYLPKTMKSFGNGAFGRLVSLDSLYIPTGADKEYVVMDKVIYNADTTNVLATYSYREGEVTLPATVTKINDYGMSGASMLTRVNLPASLKFIGNEAFAGNYALEQIRCYFKDPVALGSKVFSEMDKSSVKLYVPAGSLTKFKRAAQWKDFYTVAHKNIIEFGTSLKVRNALRRYGENNPSFGWKTEGDFVNGKPELSCEATPTSPVGKYVIHISRGTITEPMVDFHDGYLTVEKAIAEMKADDKTIDGDETLQFTYTVSGLKNNETSVVLTVQPQFGIVDAMGQTVTNYSKKGTYYISISGAESQNYTFNYTPGTLIVKSSATGIDNVQSSNPEARFDIYTVSGALIGKGVISLRSLPKGVYIVNGKKIVK